MADVVEKPEGKADASGDPSRVQEVTPGSDANSDQAKQTAVDGSQISTPKELQQESDSVVNDDHKKEEVSGSGDGEEWLDVLGSGKLRKKVLKAGQGEAARPDRGMAMTVRYKGRLQDGTEVEGEEKATFTQGEGEIVQGLL